MKTTKNNWQNKVMTVCGRCGQNIRIPISDKPLIVTCPKCRNEFRYDYLSEYGSHSEYPAGFQITTRNGKKVYLAGDTGLFGDMALIGEEGIDLAVLPIGDNYTMGPEDALRAVKLIQPKHVIPIHYNTFDLSAHHVATTWLGRFWMTLATLSRRTFLHLSVPWRSQKCCES